MRLCFYFGTKWFCLATVAGYMPVPSRDKGGENVKNR